MPRFRIVQRSSYSDSTKARFDIQERIWWSWEFIDFAWTIEEAERLILKIKDARKNPIETKVIKEYY